MKTRLSISLTEELKKFVEIESNKLGISQGAFVSMCIAQRKQAEKEKEK